MENITAKDWMESDGVYFARAANGAWVEVTDCVPENEGQDLPRVGKVAYSESAEHWVDTGKVVNNALGEPGPLMELQPREDVLVWNADVRLLAPVFEAAPEGGVLEISVSEDVGTADVPR